MNQKRKKGIDLGKDPVGGLIVRLAVPAVLAQLINLLYNLVDRMYVGSIPGHGTDALAGLGVAFPITLIVSAFSYLVGMGGAPLAGIKWARADGRTRRKYSTEAQGFCLSWARC